MSSGVILIVDDTPGNLDLLVDILEKHRYDVRVARSGRRALAAAAAAVPDLVMLDINMPEMDGYEVCRRLKAGVRTREIPVIFLSVNDDADDKVMAFRAGGSAYLLKRSAGSELLTAIREAMKHRSYVTPLVTEGMLGALMHSTSDAGSRQLTSRQREVLQLLAEGKSMKEVGSILNVTPRTVAFHKYRMMEQLKIKTNAELIQYAIRNNLI